MKALLAASLLLALAPLPAAAQEGPAVRVVDWSGRPVAGARVPRLPDGLQPGTLVHEGSPRRSYLIVDVELDWTGSAWRTGYAVSAVGQEEISDRRRAATRRRLLRLFGWLD